MLYIFQKYTRRLIWWSFTIQVLYRGFPVHLTNFETNFETIQEIWGTRHRNASWLIKVETLEIPVEITKDSVSYMIKPPNFVGDVVTILLAKCLPRGRSKTSCYHRIWPNTCARKTLNTFEEIQESYGLEMTNIKWVSLTIYMHCVVLDHHLRINP